MSNQDDLEKIVIGGIIQKPDLYPFVADILIVDQFLSKSARLAFIQISEKYGKTPINIQTVCMEVKGQEHIEWLLSSVDSIPVNVESAANKIADNSARLKLEADLHEIANKTKDSNYNFSWILEDLIKVYRDGLGGGNDNPDISSAIKRFTEEQEYNKEHGMGFLTGFHNLDDDFITYRPGLLMVIGAWTSVGKTAWSIEAIKRLTAKNEDAKVMIFSTEMTEGQNVARMLANKTGINSNVILSGGMINKHHVQIENEKKQLSTKNITIYDNQRNIADISSKARKQHYCGGVDVIFIDFIQNVYASGHKSKYEMMAFIATEIQNLALDLKCTIVCLSQLPNAAGKEDAGILEFKGAGEIAAACDVGILMKRSKENKKVILFDVRKNRHGPCKQFMMRFNDNWTGLIEHDTAHN